MLEDRPNGGAVLRYRYLWREEADAGFRDGRKDRPATIIVACSPSGETTVVPITHTAPTDPATAIEVPLEERRRIGLDDQRAPR